jgi:hypothetical protein
MVNEGASFMKYVTIAAIACFFLAIAGCRSGPSVSPEAKIDLIVEWVQQLHKSQLGDEKLREATEVDYVVTHDLRAPEQAFFLGWCSRDGQLESVPGKPVGRYCVFTGRRGLPGDNVAVVCAVTKWKDGTTTYPIWIILWDELRRRWGLGASM